MTTIARRATTTTVILAGLLVTPRLAVSPARAALDGPQVEGYLQWLDALVQTESSRARAGSDEARRLYPLDLEDTPAPPGDSARLLAVSRTLQSFEQEASAGRAARALSALEAVGAARNYRYAAEYDSALAWYGRAAARDRGGELRLDIDREALAVAAAAGDSLAVTRRLLATVGSGDQAGRDGELTVALRFLVAHRDDANLRLLVKAVAAADARGARLRLWQAYALAYLEDWDGCLAELTPLLGDGGLSLGLTAAQRAWVLVAVPDMLVLTGEPDAAAPLYGALAASGLDGVAAWGRLQAANLEFLAGAHLRASAAYAELCDDEAAEPWRGFACQMAGLSERVTRVIPESDRDGSASSTQP